MEESIPFSICVIVIYVISQIRAVTTAGLSQVSNDNLRSKKVIYQQLPQTM